MKGRHEFNKPNIPPRQNGMSTQYVSLMILDVLFRHVYTVSNDYQALMIGDR